MSTWSLTLEATSFGSNANPAPNATPKPTKSSIPRSPHLSPEYPAPPPCAAALTRRDAAGKAAIASIRFPTATGRSRSAISQWKPSHSDEPKSRVLPSAAATTTRASLWAPQVCWA